MTSPHRYPESDLAAVYRAIRERRDMRHFWSNPVDPVVLARLLAAAHQAPNVGLMQPWRFLRITDPALRQRIHALVEEERVQTAAALRAARYLGKPCSLLYAFILIPAPIRDFFYDIIAKNRYRWFGCSTICTISDQGPRRDSHDRIHSG